MYFYYFAFYLKAKLILPSKYFAYIFLFLIRFLLNSKNVLRLRISAFSSDSALGDKRGTVIQRKARRKNQIDNVHISESYLVQRVICF